MLDSSAFAEAMAGAGYLIVVCWEQYEVVRIYGCAGCAHGVKKSLFVEWCIKRQTCY